MKKEKANKKSEESFNSEARKWVIVAEYGVLGALIGLLPGLILSGPEIDSNGVVTADVGSFLLVEAVTVFYGVKAGSEKVDPPQGGGGNNLPLRPA